MIPAAPDAPDDAATEASPGPPASAPACVAAGGQCQATSTCTAIGPEDCAAGASCCFDHICAPGTGSQVIAASSYDQSCAVDSDCAGVSEGDSCKPCDFSCANAAINAGALAKYTSDSSGFPSVVAVAHGVCPSSCGDGPGGPCCVGGKCQVGDQCRSAVSAPDASVDALVASDAPGDGGCAAGCEQGEVCAYLIADACGAAGACVAPPTPSPCSAIVLEMACGCDGSAVHWNGGCAPALPDGYAPSPVTHTGACN